jgi:hypothetical protein
MEKKRETKEAGDNSLAGESKVTGLQYAKR